MDVLFNNAGVGEAGPVSEIPIDLVRRNYEVNVFGSLALTQGFIRRWVEQKKAGKIVFTSSMGGLFTPPGYGIYVFFEQIGFRPARAFVIVASLTEILSGLLVGLGLLGPIGPALMLSVLIVAGVSVHWPNGLFVASNGIEHAVIFAAGAFALALTGPGLFSLDAALGLQSLWTSGVASVAITIAVIGGVANLAARRPLSENATN
ncbi:MAG: SDR family NAD(P)-dependent oxidoreductase [Gemmatimonas sp.]|nr:SDR family NAD(P)-dependent oxidoreductase [Gemmatimonas sp.]